MTQCPFCGETSYYPAGPHNGKPCPLKVEEHKARVEQITGGKRIEELERQLRAANDPQNLMQTLKIIGYKLPELDEIFRQVGEWRRLGGAQSLLDIALRKRDDDDSASGLDTEPEHRSP